MKNLFSFIIALFFFNPCYSQCKIEKDAFTNEEVAKFDYNTLGWPANYFLSCQKKKDEISMTFCYYFQNKVEKVIPKGSEVLFKLESGEIVKCITTSDASPEPSVTNGQIWTKYNYTFNIQKTDIEKFASSKVQLMRFTDASKEGTVDTDVYRKGLKKAAECITKK
jgi:hypothetical protein